MTVHEVKVKDIVFWQPIKIDGKRIEGGWDLAYLKWKESFLPASFEGKTVLDVGCSNGYYSFLAEERGAKEVMAMDDPPNVEESGVDSRAINLAILLNDSKVKYKTWSVYDLSKIRRKFDTVIFFDVLYHLKNPVQALEEIARVCTGELYLCSLMIDREGSFALVRPEHKDPTIWFVPTIEAIEKMLTSVGFQKVEILGQNPDRVVIRASEPDPELLYSVPEPQSKEWAGRSGWSA